MDASPTVSNDFGGSDGWSVEGVKLTDKEFTPFDVEVRDPVTGRSGTVTVIGILTDKITFGLLPGIIVNEATYSAVYGAPEYRTTFFRLNSGTDGDVAAKGIKAAMLTRGV